MGNTPGTKRVIEGLQGPLLQIDVAEIIIHETNEPNAIVDFLDAEFLAGQHGGDIDPLATGAKETTPRLEKGVYKRSCGGCFTTAPDPQSRDDV